LGAAGSLARVATQRFLDTSDAELTLFLRDPRRLRVKSERIRTVDGDVLDPYRQSAAVVEASSLDYTVVRPAWFDDEDDTDYETTQKGQPFRGGTVSRLSVADLIVRLVLEPTLHVKKSVGIN